MGRSRVIQVPGAGNNQKPKKTKTQPGQIVWRVKGTPEDTRFSGVEDAERARKRIQQMKPQRLQGRREAKSLRPCRETCVRIHHSRGYKMAAFLASFKNSLGGELTEQEALSLCDSRDIGGLDLLAKWKQDQYEDCKVVDRKIIFEMTSGKFTNEVQEDGSLKMVPFIEDNPKKLKKRRKNLANKHCTSCGMAIPTSQKFQHEECVTCRPQLTAAAFFSQVKKDAQQNKIGQVFQSKEKI